MPGEPTPAERLGGDVIVFNIGHASKPVDKERIRVVAEAIRNLRKNSLQDPKI